LPHEFAARAQRLDLLSWLQRRAAVAAGVVLVPVVRFTSVLHTFLTWNVDGAFTWYHSLRVKGSTLQGQSRREQKDIIYAV
jgi:hypothetical protein